MPLLECGVFFYKNRIMSIIISKTMDDFIGCVYDIILTDKICDGLNIKLEF